jgi:hypothetical protein
VTGQSPLPGARAFTKLLVNRRKDVDRRPDMTAEQSCSHGAEEFKDGFRSNSEFSVPLSLLRTGRLEDRIEIRSKFFVRASYLMGHSSGLWPRSALE